MANLHARGGVWVSQTQESIVQGDISVVPLSVSSYLYVQVGAINTDTFVTIIKTK